MTVPRPGGAIGEDTVQGEEIVIASEQSAPPGRVGGAETPRRLRIAYVSDAFGDQSTGAVQSSLRFVEALRRHHDITLIATGEPAPGKIVVPAVRLPLFQRLIDSNGFALGRPSRKLLREALRGHDLVYVHYSLLLGFAAISEARDAGIPVVMGYHFQPHNIWYNINIRSEWINRLTYRLFIRGFYNRVDRVICPSEPAREELTRNGFNGVAEVISNGLPERFRPIDCERPAEWGEKFVIMMVGRLSHEKRHDVVFEAIRRSRHRDRIQLVITGTGPIQQRIERAARSMSVPAQTGYIPQETLIRYLNSADLLVHASEAELEGMAVLEAIGCGLPALIANAPASAARQFALDERFLFPAGEASALAERIDHFIDHREELDAARPRYRELSLQYGFDAALARMEALFGALASQPHSADRGRSGAPG